MNCSHKAIMNPHHFSHICFCIIFSYAENVTSNKSSNLVASFVNVLWYTGFCCSLQTLVNKTDQEIAQKRRQWNFFTVGTKIVSTSEAQLHIDILAFNMLCHKESLRTAVSPHSITL